MKILTLLLASGMLLPGVALATGEWRLVGSCPAPAPNPRDVCWGISGHFAYVLLCDAAPPKVYEFNLPPWGGFTGRYFTLDVPPGVWGISNWAWWLSEEYYAVSNYRNSYIYAVTTTGSVVSSFLCPKKHPAGIDRWGGHNGLIAIPDENLAISVDRNGSIINSFSGPGTRMTAIEHRYVITDEEKHTVYCGSYGTISLPRPVGVFAHWKTGAGNRGEPPPFDGVTVSDAATKYIYVYFPWNIYTEQTPASLGRVKALFR